MRNIGKDIGPLQKVTQLLFDRDLRALQSIQAEENKLRQELAALRESQKTRAAHTPPEIKQAYALSGEQQWVVWVDARLKILNGQLAHLLARKSFLTEAAAKSLGRKTALEAVARKDGETARRARNRREQEKLLDLRLQSRAAGRDRTGGL
ncbi:hypothetical protein PGB28_17570 [Primorskyibacter aestuariivivens]|uniref:hypothetical protein n=1 Tax=Primorskyibacter aestuariivivens TaxID=1888912 RepID=UPI002300FE2A|nr:hypothetical protein [Primorskyibacter aestuariivivens]MDA7430276.1 hypothetical protein [Primorskyibacter aestuariivivens]